MAIDGTLNYLQIWSAVSELRARFHQGEARMENSGRHTRTDEEEESSETESHEDED